MFDTGKTSGNVFSEYNPVINFLFYISAIVFGMFFVHPIFLLISCVLAAAYYMTIRGTKALKLIVGLIPVFVIVSLINPLLNRYGEHVLFMWAGGRPYTLESLYYGMAIGAMFVAITLWFATYNVVMTSDKFMYVFGAMAPSITLVLTMVLRFVPDYIARTKQIAGARNSIGKAGSQEKKRDRLNNGMTIVSALTSWALEGGIVTSDSMRSRGYGCGKRTSFSIYRFDSRDRSLMLFMILLIAVVLICGVKGGMSATYTPQLSISGVDNPFTVLGLIAYFVLLVIPTFITLREEIVWRILRSRI